MASPDPAGFPALPRTHRTPVVLIAVIACVSAVALIALLIAVGGGPVPALTGLVLAVIPVPLVAVGLLYLDRLEPEPPALLAAVFGGGMAVALLIGLVGQALRTQLITTPELGPQAGRLIAGTLGAAIGGAVVAESLKGGVLVALLRFRGAELDGTQDGVVYASITGLGFALMANLFAYLHAEHSGLGAVASAFAQRGLLTPLWSPLFSSMIGIGVSYAALHRGQRGLWAIGAGWVAAVALHAMWDDSVATGTGRAAIVYLVLLAVLAAVIAAMIADRRRIVGLISAYSPAYRAAGVATGEDVDMLTSLRWRRHARQWARLHRGRAGARAMAEYQLAATELALAANRADRDLMQRDDFRAASEHSLRLMRAAMPVFRDGKPKLQLPPWAALATSAFTASPRPAGGQQERPPPGRA